MITQKDLILNHLQAVGSITARQAASMYGIDRLSARILELKMNHDIKSKLIAVRGRNGKAWVSRYSLV